MPYIKIDTGVILSEKQKDDFKTRLGKDIELISGKKEARLMIGICDGMTMYYGGTKEPKTAYVDVVLYKSASMEDKKKFVASIAQNMCEIFNIDQKNIYIVVNEYDNIGTNGEFI